MENENEKSDQNLINVNDVEVIIKIKDEGKLKATAILRYKNINIKGFRIMDSEYDNVFGDKIWIQPPSYFAGRYQPMFFLEPKEEWKKMEEAIIIQFKKSQQEYYKKKFKVQDNSEEELEIENIKFNN
ncbi:MAG: hypothetical protein PHZ07_01295 [Patescibacteria group bacterium]|nr:hypothetical protein [Patescibacteria group bacterium]MDD4303928.1 hypothetical protein [Patescibacteria group bacterium]MDD4695084.1 hypothetical protein [Patescibacteria group bacterium]